MHGRSGRAGFVCYTVGGRYFGGGRVRFTSTSTQKKKQEEDDEKSISRLIIGIAKKSKHSKVTKFGRGIFS